MSPGGDAIFRLWRSDMLSEGKRDMFSHSENVRETRKRAAAGSSYDASLVRSAICHLTVTRYSAYVGAICVASHARYVTGGDEIFRLWRIDVFRCAKLDMFSQSENVKKGTHLAARALFFGGRKVILRTFRSYEILPTEITIRNRRGEDLPSIRLLRRWS